MREENFFSKIKQKLLQKKNGWSKKENRNSWKSKKKNLRNVRGKVKFFEKEKYHILYKKGEIPSKKI